MLKNLPGEIPGYPNEEDINMKIMFLEFCVFIFIISGPIFTLTACWFLRNDDSLL